jgi:hypothetical protein
MLPTQSDQIDQLTAAFVEARKAAKPFSEDSKANYGSYVSIDEIKACTNKALLDNGLSLTQTRTMIEGQIALVTKLTHISGQWQASYVPLIITENPKNIDQAYGSSMTYQRRYELYGLFAFKGEELDPDAVDSKKSHQPASSKPSFGNGKLTFKDEYAHSKLMDFHIKGINDLFNKFENPEQFKKDYLKACGVKDLAELKQSQGKEIYEDLLGQLED